MVAAVSAALSHVMGGGVGVQGWHGQIAGSRRGLLDGHVQPGQGCSLFIHKRNVGPGIPGGGRALPGKDASH